MSYPGSAAQAGPKKETARISILPEPSAPPKPAVKMTKTQPLLTVPETKKPVASVSITPAPAAGSSRMSVGELSELLDQVPLPVCWTIFGISTVTLLIQIWNYLSS